MSPSVLIRTRAVSDVEVAGSRVKTSVSLRRATCRGGHVEAVFFSPQHILHPMNNDDVYGDYELKKQRIVSHLSHALMQQAHTRFLLLGLVRQPSLAAFDPAI